MNEKSPLETLQDIRNLMERSSRFLSLSGLSGIVIGLMALAVAATSVGYVQAHRYSVTSYYLLAFKPNGDTNSAFLYFHEALAAVLVVASLAVSLVYSRRMARKQGIPTWDRTARRMVVNMSIPLVAGGLFILALLQRLEISLIAPAMLIFYGLALIHASKYTFDDIRTLGLLQVLAGLVGAFVPAWGLICWAMGFGVLHIVYGLVMHFKYSQ